VQRTQAENGTGPTVANLVEPMLAGMTTTRQYLLAWVPWGTAPTELTFGGRRVQVRRPRVRRAIGGGALLPSVAAFRARDPLTARMMQQLLAGVSMREYEGSLEARPLGRRARSTSIICGRAE
jgi:hypothetical protein